MSQNLYEILEVPIYSEISTVKKAFRQLALKFHPDRNPNPEVVEKFKGILKAYEILNQPEQKKAYDKSLQFGAEYPFMPYVKAESAEDLKRKWYAKVRMEMDEVKQVEDITSYENSLGNFPFKWRMIIDGLVLFTSILLILNDWFSNGSNIAIGIILYIISTLYLWNELYKYYWHQSLTKVEKKYEQQAYSWFIGIFLSGIILTGILINLKKIWHLSNFGETVYANLDYYQREIAYSYGDKVYLMNIHFVPKKYIYEKQILIIISTKDPHIWEFYKN